MLNKEGSIGGYFEFELPQVFSELYPTSLKFQSARYAFIHFLKQKRICSIWMPRYICRTMIDPLLEEGIEVKFYGIGNDFEIEDHVKLEEQEFIFYVNYFGICSENQKRMLFRFDPDKIIFDHSQSFFQSPLQCFATIYSPRKFFGLPDGGLLMTKDWIDLPIEQDEDSFLRTSHLLKRLSFEAEVGYLDYKKADESLIGLSPKRMSKLTERIYKSIDHETIRIKRNENFISLHSQLHKKNKIKIDLSSIDGPLVYPFLSSINNLREFLIDNRVYTATYWPDCVDYEHANNFEKELINNMISLPIDQRYSLEDMNKIVELIFKKEKLLGYSGDL